MTDTTTISAEALRRLQIEAAFARGKRIVCRWADRSIHSENWSPALTPRWKWDEFDYRVAESVSKRTAAEICTEIEKLVAELRSVTE